MPIAEDRAVTPFARGALFVGPLAAFVAAWAIPAHIGGEAGVAITGEARIVAGLAVLMAVWWIAEAAPLEMTALLPLVVLPVTGATTFERAAGPYASEQIYLFLGGFLLGISLEQSGLHRRLALGILRVSGARAANLVGGLMLATGVISAFVSNTATTIVMLPVALGTVRTVGGDRSAPPGLVPCAVLGVAFGASVGGVATLIGTPPNALFAGFAQREIGRTVDFAHWMIVGVPVAVILLPLTWVLLTRVIFRVGNAPVPGAAESIELQRAALGRPSRAEIATGVVLGLAAVVWILRVPLCGWLGLTRTSPTGAVTYLLTDGGIAIGAACALFLIPAGPGARRHVLEWRDTAQVPWGVLLLFGGGLSLASAISATGLDRAVGAACAGLGTLPIPVLVVVVSAMVVALSELGSNTAVAAAVLPIMHALELRMGAPPGSLLVPATLACSGGFMLPVATPPNTLAYATGEVTAGQMRRAGIWLDLTTIAVIVGVSVPLSRFVVG